MTRLRSEPCTQVQGDGAVQVSARAALGPRLAAGVRIGPGLAAGALMLAFAHGVYAQDITDAVAREFTVFNNLADPVPPSDALAREFTLFNDLADPLPLDDALAREFTLLNDLVPPDVFTDAVAREVSTLTVVSAVFVSSSDDAAAYPVSGTLPQQLTALNAAPPAYDPNTWQPVYRRNDDLDDEFVCGEVPNPLDRAYVSADAYWPEADEVTWDNCNSAFYRFEFELPFNAWAARLSGSANVDDQGVAFVNGNRLSGLMTVPNCNPTGGPGDPCYLQQDAGHDRADAQGVDILTWPTFDPFGSVQTTYMQPGTNALVIGVCGNAAYYEPTGVEFTAVVTYWLRGDLNCDGVVDFDDINPFVLALSNPAAYQTLYPHCSTLNGDCNANNVVNFDDINPFVAILAGG